MSKTRIDRIKDALATYPVVNFNTTQKDDIIELSKEELSQQLLRDRPRTLENIQLSLQDYVNNRKIDHLEARWLSEIHFPEKDIDGWYYAYRWIVISFEQLKNIVSHEWLKVYKTDDDELCFTTTNAYNARAIEHASNWWEWMLSVIFQIPINLLQKYKIPHSWFGDKFVVKQDISVDILKESKIFIMNYKSNTLNQVSVPNDKDKIPPEEMIARSIKKSLDADPFLNILNKGYKWLCTVSHWLNWIPFFGWLKIVLEAALGYTLAIEKLWSASRKLYGLAWWLSSLWYTMLYLAGTTWHPELATTYPFLSWFASVCTAAWQLGVVTESSDAWQLLKAMMLEYLSTIKQKIWSIGKKEDQEIKDIKVQIEKLESDVSAMSPEELWKWAMQIHNAITKK